MSPGHTPGPWAVGLGIRRHGGTGWLAPTGNPARGGPHLVPAGVGRGRLWDCSRARCWLASVGRGARCSQDLGPRALPSRSLEGQGLGLLRGTKHARGAGNRPSPLHACSWLVSTFRISLTQAALISGVGACAPEQTRGDCVPTVTCASVSLCRCPGPVGTGGQCCTGGAGRSPGARVRWLPGPHPAALTLTQREPSGEGALTTGCAGRCWTLSIPGWCRAGRWLRPLPLQLCGPLAGRAGWCVVSCDQVARASSLPWGHIPQGRQGPDHQACQSCGGQRGESPPGLSCSLGVSVRRVDAPRAPPSPTPTAR